MSKVFTLRTWQGLMFVQDNDKSCELHNLFLCDFPSSSFFIKKNPEKRCKKRKVRKEIIAVEKAFFMDFLGMKKTKV
jgi:hypothetical protein